MVYCGQCGAQNPDQNRFCSHCGALLMVPIAAQQYYYYEPPKPEPEYASSPKRSLFMVGEGGSFFTALIALLLGIFYIILLFSYSSLSFYSATVYVLIIAFTLMFLVTSILKSMGYLGFSVNYKSHFGIAAMVFGIVAPALFLFMSIIGFYSYYSYSYYALGPLVWVGHILVGIMTILMGVSILLVGRPTRMMGMCIAAGTLMIMSGGLLIALVGFIGVAWFILFVADLIAGFIFAKAYLPVPVQMPEPMQQSAPSE